MPARRVHSPVSVDSLWGVHLDRARRAIEATYEADLELLLAAAALELHGDEFDAVDALTDRFGLSRSQATRLVRSLADSPVLVLGGDTVMAKLSGIDVDEETEDAVLGYLALAVEDGIDESTFALSDLIGEATMQAAVSAAQGSQPVRLVTASVLASRDDELEDLLGLLPTTTPYDAAPDVVRRALTVASAYLLRCVANGALDLGDEAWDIADSDALVRWAVWACGVVDPHDSQGLEELLGDAERLGLDVVAPGDDPFDLSPEIGWVEDIRNLAGLLSSDLVGLESPVWFDGDDVEIYLTEAGGHVSAWVGHEREGVFVSFDTTDFAVLGMPLPGMPFAAGCAIAWYIDCCLPNRDTTPGTRSGVPSTRGRSTLRNYRPVAEFQEQVDAIENREHAPPRAHFVAAHIRHLVDKQPNRSHVAQAPERLRRRMGPRDTWVIGHMRGSGNASEILTRLRRCSALADALGLLKRDLARD